MTNDLEKQIELVLSDLKSTKNFKFTSDNTGIHHSDIYGWISKGKDTGEEPYYSFYIDAYKILGLIPDDNTEKPYKTTSNNTINEKLKSFSIDDFNMDVIYQFDYKLSIYENIIRKFILKKRGKDLEDNKEYREAIEYYLALLDNSYFENDYYIYRRLIICYGRLKEWKNRIEVIKDFFQSSIYASEYQIQWMVYKLFRSEEHGDISPEEVDYYIEYYGTHGARNKDLENYPVVLADRIYQSKKDSKIGVEPYYKYEKFQYKLQLVEFCEELERNEEYEEALDFCWFHVANNVYGSTELYGRIVEIYEKLEDWDNELIALSIVFRKKFNIIGNYMKKYFKKRLDVVNKNLNTNFSIDDLRDKNFTVINDSEYHNLSNDEILDRYEKLSEQGLLRR